MERIVQVIPCSQDEKVTFATHLLRGLVTRWWTDSESSEGLGAFQRNNHGHV